MPSSCGGPGRRSDTCSSSLPLTPENSPFPGVGLCSRSPVQRLVTGMYSYVDHHSLRGRAPYASGPLLVRSFFRALDTRIPMRGVGIKYVMQGVERYTVNGQYHPVGRDRYLVVNGTCTGRVAIDSDKGVAGLCVELPHDLVNEVAATLTAPGGLDSIIPDCGLTDDRLRPSAYAAGLTRVGMLLRQLSAAPEYTSQEDRPVGMEVYHRLVEALLVDQARDGVLSAMIPAVSRTTREELFRRVELGRAYMHDHAASPLSVAQMAAAAAMSEYHFSRAFRNVHGRSPYAYLLELRSAAAKELVQGSDLSLTDIAASCGFADLQTFSRFFKRRFGAAPSLLRASRRNC